MQFITILAGHNFRPAECKQALAEIRAGAEHTLLLERDAGNPYDVNAIKVVAKMVRNTDEPDGVYFEDFFIGFVAGPDAIILAPYLDNTASSDDVAPGHTPTVDRVEIIDWVSGDKKPTIVIEVSTGFELGTLVSGPDADQDGDDDYLSGEEDEVEEGSDD